MPRFSLPCATPRPPRPPRSRGLWMTDDRPCAAGLPSRFGGPGTGRWGGPGVPGVPGAGKVGPGWWPRWPLSAWPWPGVCRCGRWSWCRRTGWRRRRWCWTRGAGGWRRCTGRRTGRRCRWRRSAGGFGWRWWTPRTRGSGATAGWTGWRWRGRRPGTGSTGGSSITQQYVKNTYVTGERTLRRKLAEAGHAWGLERRNPKEAILEAYLNTVYFGLGAYGVEAAAQTYFSTRAARLTLTQAALLTGMIRSPSAYDPFRHPRAARARRAAVLARVERNGHLSPTARRRAAAAPLGLRPGVPATAKEGTRGGSGARSVARPEVPRAPWFVSWVLDQLLDPADHRFDVLGTSRRARTDMVFTGGLRIITTVDLGAQAAAERAVTSVAGRRGRDPYGALVAVEPGTGAVRAMVGGRSWWDDARFGRVNLATGAGGGGRPAGSAFKTFALVAALKLGIPPEAVFAAPDRLVVRRAGRHGPAWRVANYEGHGFGKATLRTATALSINTVYAGLLLRLGGGDPDRGARAVVEAAARMGVDSPLRAVPSAVLGTGEVTPLEMAAAYATLAAGGRRAAPFGVARITGPDGRVLYQARQGAGQVVKPSVAAIATDVLRGVVDRGTGVRGRIGRPAAAKTGTTQDHADAWFVGFTPSLAAAVWIGYPQGQVPMVPPRVGSRVSGGTWPAAIWSRFMRSALAGEPPGRFPRPDTSLVQLALDLKQGACPTASRRRPRSPRSST